MTVLLSLTLSLHLVSNLLSLKLHLNSFTLIYYALNVYLLVALHPLKYPILNKCILLINTVHESIVIMTPEQDEDQNTENKLLAGKTVRFATNIYI